MHVWIVAFTLLSGFADPPAVKPAKLVGDEYDFLRARPMWKVLRSELLFAPSVQRDLKIAPEQVERLIRYGKDLDAAGAPEWTDGRIAIVDGVLRLTFGALDERSAEMLTPAQNRRLDQIQFRLLGPEAWIRLRMAAAALDVSEERKAALKKTVRPPVETGPLTSRERRESETGPLAALTPAGRKALETMQGEPFVAQLLSPRTARFEIGSPPVSRHSWAIGGIRSQIVEGPLLCLFCEQMLAEIRATAAERDALRGIVRDERRELRKRYPPAARYRYGYGGDMVVRDRRAELLAEKSRMDAAVKQATEILGAERFRRFEEAWVQARGISGLVSPGTPVFDRVKITKGQLSDFNILAARRTKDDGPPSARVLWLKSKADEILTEEQRALYRQLQGAPLESGVLNELKAKMYSFENSDEFMIPRAALGVELDPAGKN